MRAPTLPPMLTTAAITVAVALIGSGSALAQDGSDEASGGAILRSVQQGERSCSQLSSRDFELVGEAWMGQALGSRQAHEAMNRLMASMMGSSGEERMHEYIGHRASGCGGGSVPSGFGRMMGSVAMMGGAPGSAGASGMMGGAGGGYSAPGSMMRGYRQTSDADDDGGGDGPSAAAMVGVLAVLIGAVAIALAVFKPWRHPHRPQDLLDRRFAAGELGAEEYRRAKSLLKGSSP